MTDHTAPQVVRNYLAQLEAALGGVSTDVRDSIVAGVAEELSGLDAATAAMRIETLGDPAFIAAEARAESPAPVVTAAAPVPEFGMSSQRWYIVLTTALLEFGGIVIPLAGWVVGIMLLWASPLWTRAEKLVATIVPPAAAALVVVGALVLDAAASFLAPTAVLGPEAINPVMPHTMLWNASFLCLVAAVIASIVIGIVLSRRAWRRTAR